MRERERVRERDEKKAGRERDTRMYTRNVPIVHMADALPILIKISIIIFEF